MHEASVLVVIKTKKQNILVSHVTRKEKTV